jgi:hypothetical protein
MLTLARRVVLQCLAGLLPTILVTLPGDVKTVETGDYVPKCWDQEYPNAGCLTEIPPPASIIVAGGGGSTYKFTPATCPTPGGEPFCRLDSTPKCCKTAPSTATLISEPECGYEVPKCKLDVMGNVITTHPSPSGFFTKNCKNKPLGCSLCQYCCSHAFGSDKVKADKCKKFVCDVYPVFDKCVMRLRDRWLLIACCVYVCDALPADLMQRAHRLQLLSASRREGYCEEYDNCSDYDRKMDDEEENDGDM